VSRRQEGVRCRRGTEPRDRSRRYREADRGSRTLDRPARDRAGQARAAAQAGLLVAAAVLLLFGLGFALAGAAAGLDVVLPLWASLLIVAGGIVLVAGALAGIGIASLKKGTPPVPEQALEEARLTTEALRSNGRG
jgi:hypothetical protein